MIAQILSDLHTEHWRLLPEEGKTDVMILRETVHRLISDKADVILLAGDICSYVNAKSFYAAIDTVGKPVIFIAGNHEFYGNSLLYVKSLLTGIALESNNLIFLDNKVHTIGNHRFVGSTMWGDEVHGLDDPYITDGFRGLSGEAHRSYMFLSDDVQNGDIVMTHHLPGYDLVDPQYFGSRLNPFFVRTLPDPVRARAKVWVYGHTHMRNTRRVGDTTYVCNPYGYPGELRDTYHKRLINLDTGETWEEELAEEFFP